MLVVLCIVTLWLVACIVSASLLRLMWDPYSNDWAYVGIGQLVVLAMIFTMPLGLLWELGKVFVRWWNREAVEETT